MEAVAGIAVRIVVRMTAKHVDRVLRASTGFFAGLGVLHGVLHGVEHGIGLVIVRLLPLSIARLPDR